jgi:hypothetical protein
MHSANYMAYFTIDPSLIVNELHRKIFVRMHKISAEKMWFLTSAQTVVGHHQHPELACGMREP